MYIILPFKGKIEVEFLGKREFLIKIHISWYFEEVIFESQKKKKITPKL